MPRSYLNDSFRVDGETIDLDRMGREMARHYLHVQISRLNQEIEQLIFIQAQPSWQRLERAAWGSPEAAEVVWSGRLELHYLQMVREMLLEQLQGL